VFKLILDSRGNPDFGQNHRQRMPMVPRRIRRLTSYAQASAACQSYITYHGLGGGNWAGGQILDAQTGEQKAHVSYNGKVWAGREEDWTAETPCLYNPYL